MAKPSLAEFKNLSVSERILHVQDLWDNIIDEPDSVDLTDVQRAELDRRLERFTADPDAGTPWEEVRDSARSKR